MAYLGWACLGGVEIVNDCRTLQRVADGFGPPGMQCRACDPCCGDIAAGLGYPNGWSVASLPWFDGTQDSVDFAGLLIETIEGLEPGPFTRPVTESAGYGAVIGQGRQSAPTVVVTGLLLAATCCAAEFGLGWLRNTLRGSCTPTSLCAGDDLVFLSCEPETPDLDCPENADFDFEAWLAPYLRTIKGAALIDGPRVVERVARACADCNQCSIYRVQFTLAARKPCVYRDPVTLVEVGQFVCAEPDGDCYEWVTDAAATCVEDNDPCPTNDGCGTDPDCQSTVAPPSVPLTQNVCVDDCDSTVECRFCVDIPAGTFPSTGEGTLLISIFSGSEPMRRIKVQVWQNVIDADPDDLNNCDVCSELNISYVAADSTLVLDGGNGTSVITCPGGQDVRANAFIASGSGSPNFSYPSIESCAGRHTVCITAAAPVAMDASVRIEAIGREC